MFVVHLPVPVRRVPTDHIQNLKMDDQKFYAKSKSKATRARDKTRKQKFIEGKTVCSGFPFFGLEDDELRNETVNEVASQEMKMVSKLKAAEKNN